MTYCDRCSEEYHPSDLTYVEEADELNCALCVIEVLAILATEGGQE